MTRVARIRPLAAWVRATFAGVGVSLLGLAGAHAAPSIQAGTVQEFQIPSRHQGKNRRVWVYTPPGYVASRDTSLALLLALDGNDFLQEFHFAHVVDSLQAAGATPRLIAVLMDKRSGAERRDDLANRAWFVDFVADEVLPWVRSRWRVSRDPGRTAIAGTSAGGLAAVHIALRRPGLFGNVLSQSGAFWRGNEDSNSAPFLWLLSQVGRWPLSAVRLHLEVGTAENQGTLGGTAPSILSANRAMRDTLRAHGYEVTYVEVPNGVHDVETWAPRFPAALAALF
jgi:enterochelin esterase family protein